MCEYIRDPRRKDAEVRAVRVSRVVPASPPRRSGCVATLTKVDHPAPTPSTPPSGALWRLQLDLPGAEDAVSVGREALRVAFDTLDALDVVAAVSDTDDRWAHVARALELGPIRPLNHDEWLVGCAASDWLRQVG